jgi:uncharacterized protein (TIGR02453 family)
MAFNGWPAEALDFYDGLEEDNSKAYWTANKAIYERCVLAPMTELIEELAQQEAGQLAGSHERGVKIFRPYRDVRFSADKSPYKTQIGATIGSGYLQFSASGLAAGNGMYQLASDQLARYRQAVAQDVTGHELERLIAGITGHGYLVTGREQLKTAPRGHSADHPRIELLRYKGLIAWQEWPTEPWLSTAAAKDRVADFLTVSQPLADWLNDHVGPSDLVESRRR